MHNEWCASAGTILEASFYATRSAAAPALLALLFAGDIFRI